MATPSHSSLSILRKTQVCERIACSRSSLHNKISPKSKYFDSTFPKPIRLGANSVGWIEGEIDAWLQSRERVNGTSEIAASATHATLRPQEDQASAPLAECLVRSGERVDSVSEIAPLEMHANHGSQVDKASTQVSVPLLKSRPIQVEVRKKRHLQVSCTQ